MSVYRIILLLCILFIILKAPLFSKDVTEGFCPPPESINQACAYFTKTVQYSLLDKIKGL